MAPNDVYKDLRLRGYEYSGQFQGILKATSKGIHIISTLTISAISFMSKY